MVEPAADTDLDFEVVDRVEVRDAVELASFLKDRPADGPGVRLCGAGTGQLDVPAPGRPVALVSLARLNRVLRLEPDDLTCSVEAGVTRAELDAALAERGLCLPCEGGGTVGGSFARGAATPRAPGGHSPRSLLLGFEAVLAEGLAFKSGARVVKSVAGFDLAKLFVGSRGRLFAVTALHLKLRPLPRTRRWFVTEDLDAAAALTRFSGLRLSRVAPAWTALAFHDGHYLVSGCFEGHPAVVDAVFERLGLAVAEPQAAEPVAPHPGPGFEVLDGHVRPSRIAELCELLPQRSASLWVDGVGRAYITVPEAASDELLERMAGIGASAEVLRGRAERRGRGTPIDPATQRLMRDLGRALDPRGLLS